MKDKTIELEIGSNSPRIFGLEVGNRIVQVLLEIYNALISCSPWIIEDNILSSTRSIKGCTHFNSATMICVFNYNIYLNVYNGINHPNF